MRPVLIVLPTSKLSGGALEVTHIVDQLKRKGEYEVHVVTLFGKRSEQFEPCVEYGGTSKLRAVLMLPLVVLRLARLLGSLNPEYVVCTHAITWPLCLFTHGIIFVQALEWKFFKNRAMQAAAKYVLVPILRRAARVVVANRYLSQELSANGVPVHHDYNLWITSFFSQSSYPDPTSREFDVMAFLRPGDVKRLDRFREVLPKLAGLGARIAAVCWNESISQEFSDSGMTLFTQMNQKDLKDLYTRCRYILMLSEHEGFALPPLEAMASGCVPIATRCGGPESYINDGENGLLVRNDTDNATVAAEIVGKYLNGDWRILSENAWRSANAVDEKNARNFLPVFDLEQVAYPRAA